MCSYYFCATVTVLLDCLLPTRQKLWKDINTFFNGQFGPA